ncbi:MAG: FlgD immunoglobulin-like domain containing protein [Candidatus Eisenbacteria bacterium]
MKRISLVTLVASLLACASGLAQAQVITVNCGTDPIDIDPATATVANLPGPDGKVSLSEAMIVSNNMPGRQTIAFAIPQSEWQWQGLYPGIAVIWTEYSFYLTAYDAVTIDGTTQTAFTGDTNPAGAEVYLFGAQLYFSADDCVVRGTTHMQLRFEGSREVIEDNSDVGVTLYRGAGSLVRRNQGGVVTIDQSNDNVVTGNTFGRVRVLGATAAGFPATGNRVGGPEPSDRNDILGYGTWNNQGTPGGFAVQIFDTDSTLLENNSIGTLPDGMTPANPATTTGVAIDDQNTHTVVRNNRIAGILAYSRPFIGTPQPFGTGIAISGSCDGIEIVGNTIGLNAAGEPVLGSVNGIDVGSFFSPGLQNIHIGGAAPGLGNTIAGNLYSGILVGREVQNTRISGNSIHTNQVIGVDLVTTLSAYGVTANDPLDPDTGGNALQNFPSLQVATSTGSTVHAEGLLQSAPSADYTVEFFASPGCGTSGHGEGRTYLGSTAVTTNGSGSGTFAVTLSATAPVGWVLTSTATRVSTGASSEFSSCRALTPGATADVGSAAGVPRLALAPPLPNPSRGSTTLRYVLPAQGTVTLSIHDVAGRLVRTLSPGPQDAGAHELQWDGHDSRGRAVAAGRYLARAQAGGMTVTRSITITR